MNYNWVPLSATIIIKKSIDIYKPYGIYTRNGIEYFRNHRRHLKNGKGLNLCDIMQWKIIQTRNDLNKKLYESIFSN